MSGARIGRGGDRSRGVRSIGGFRPAPRGVTMAALPGADTDSTGG
jgi:hypothetical protein